MFHIPGPSCLLPTTWGSRLDPKGMLHMISIFTPTEKASLNPTPPSSKTAPRSSFLLALEHRPCRDVHFSKQALLCLTGAAPHSWPVSRRGFGGGRARTGWTSTDGMDKGWVAPMVFHTSSLWRQNRFHATSLFFLEWSHIRFAKLIKSCIHNKCSSVDTSTSFCLFRFAPHRWRTGPGASDSTPSRAVAPLVRWSGAGSPQPDAAAAAREGRGRWVGCAASNRRGISNKRKTLSNEKPNK